MPCMHKRNGLESQSPTRDDRPNSVKGKISHDHHYLTKSPHPALNPGRRRPIKKSVPRLWVGKNKPREPLCRVRRNRLEHRYFHPDFKLRPTGTLVCRFHHRHRRLVPPYMRLRLHLRDYHQLRKGLAGLALVLDPDPDLAMGGKEKDQRQWLISDLYVRIERHGIKGLSTRFNVISKRGRMSPFPALVGLNQHRVKDMIVAYNLPSRVRAPMGRTAPTVEQLLPVAISNDQPHVVVPSPSRPLPRHHLTTRQDPHARNHVRSNRQMATVNQIFHP